MIQQAEEHLDIGDRRQAVKKARGAIDHRVWAIARKIGWQYETYTDFHKMTPLIAELTDDPGTRAAAHLPLHPIAPIIPNQIPPKNPSPKPLTPLTLVL